MPAQAPKPDSLQALREGFLNPPDAAKPMVRWWWFGPAVVKPEILRELQQMKANGIGGAELAFVYPEVLDDPAKNLKNLPFLSPEMLDAVTYAQAEGRKLGLRIDVTLCSGWPYGGPATTLDQAVTRLRTQEVAVAANESSVATPKLAEGETLLGGGAGEPGARLRRWCVGSLRRRLRGMRALLRHLRRARAAPMFRRRLALAWRCSSSKATPGSR